MLLFLCALFLGSANASNLDFPVISGAVTDGSATSAKFALRLSSDGAGPRPTTKEVLDLALVLEPNASDIGFTGSVYTVFVRNSNFFLLDENRHFVSWDGRLETLVPVVESLDLEPVTTIKIISARIESAGEYQVFVAYSRLGSSSLQYTPNPALLIIDEADQSPALLKASQIFASGVEENIVQQRCIACHVTGGLARDTGLQFQRSMTGSSGNNLAAIQSYLSVGKNSAATLLDKATGGASHVGGEQIAEGTNEFVLLSEVLNLLEQDQNLHGEVLTYSFASDEGQADQLSAQTIFSAVTLESREASFRRAAILLASRVPSMVEYEQLQSGNDETLRSMIRGLMSEPQFRNFIVEATNDRLLIEGAEEGPINQNFINFPEYRNRVYDIEVVGGRNSAYEFIERINIASKRASGELIAHVVMNELPYSEILTADYMMMNSVESEMLGSDVVFPENAPDDFFLPARITQYYFPDELESGPKHPDAGFQVLSRGKPMSDYPHAGLLTDFGFLTRYPTTATNRNRARARWTLFHFLGIDIEKSSQRPTDETALSDRNNPTLNNPACTVCHTVLDPVAGAFQNWSDFNLYRQNNGTDALDRFYKHPEDGSDSLYQNGDVWYRDMRSPGLFEHTITEDDYTLRELANLIVQEPGFLTAAARFWWEPIFGKPLLDLPSVATDQGFAEKSAAYQAQQAAIDDFARVLAQELNGKEMLVEMLMSPWFAAETSTRYEFEAIHSEIGLGSERLLTPAQLANKTLSLTGARWRSSDNPSGSVYDKYDDLSVILGGIDSRAVTERATELTPSMLAVWQTHAAELACPIVLRDFSLPHLERRLFDDINLDTTPRNSHASTLEVSGTHEEDWRKYSDYKFSAQIPANGAELNLSFVNPWCNWDGENCIEQRVLSIDSITLAFPNGVVKIYEAESPEVSLAGQHCNRGNSEVIFWGACNLTILLDSEQESAVEITARLAAKIAPSRPEPAKAIVELYNPQDLYSADSNNAQVIQQKLVSLFAVLHGGYYDTGSRQIQQAFSLFVSAFKAAGASEQTYVSCDTWRDGNFWVDLLTEEQLAQFRTPSENGDYYESNWDQIQDISGALYDDPLGTKRAWVAVIAYLLMHYDYLHE